MQARHVLMTTAAIAALAGAARAQGEAEGGGALVQEVIVTAEKREVSLQEVPVAISAFTAETRQIVGIQSLQDLTNFTPGLSYSGDDRVFIRGIGRQTNTNGSDPGVAAYSDGVYNGSNISVGASDFFVDRVEILRGPQGTLYGRNSIGGAINVISKRPTRSWSGELRGALGNYERRDVEAYVSGPLAEGLRMRLGAARYEQDEGYFENVAGGPSEGGKSTGYYGEFQVEADLGEDVTAWAKVFTRQNEGRPRDGRRLGPYDYSLYPQNALVPGGAFGYMTTGFRSLGPGTNPAIDDPRAFNTDVPSQSKLNRNFGLSTDVVWRGPGFDVRYIGGVEAYRFTSLSDSDGTSMLSYTVPLSPGATCLFIPGCQPVTIAPGTAFGYLEDKSFGSSEINISSNGDSAFQWIVGAYYYAERFDQESHFNAENLQQLRRPANGPLLSGQDFQGDFVFAGSYSTTKSSALFGQADWDLNPQLRLTAGLRYTSDEKVAREAIRIVCYGCGGFPPNVFGTSTPALDVTSSGISLLPARGVVEPVRIDPNTGVATRKLAADWNGVTGTLGLEWKPDDDTMAYARYGRGYKSGGFNAGGITAQTQTDPEYVDSFEVGYKRTFAGAFQLNAAAFYYKYKDLQIPLTFVNPAGVSVGVFNNLEKSTSYGLELEALWQATDALQVLASYGYNKAEIDKACCFIDPDDPRAVQPGAQPSGPLSGGSQAQDVSGEELPGATPHKIGLNANYRFDFDAGDLVLSASYVWKDRTYNLIFNREYTRIPSYDQLDLRAVWTSNDDRYRVIGYVKNVFDTLGYNSASGDLLASPPAAANTVSRTLGLTPPRTYGIQVQYRFN